MRPVNRHIQNSLDNRLYYLSKPHPNMVGVPRVYRRMWKGCRTIGNYQYFIRKRFHTWYVFKRFLR